MNTYTSAIAKFKVAIIALALVVGVQFASAAWIDPSATPPSNNTDTPLNVGNTLQQKLGSLAVNTDTANPYAVGLTVFGKSVFNGSVQIVDGTQGAGKVLTSDANGGASWMTPGTNTTAGATGAAGQNGTNAIPAGGTIVAGVQVSAKASPGKGASGYSYCQVTWGSATCTRIEAGVTIGCPSGSMPVYSGLNVYTYDSAGDSLPNGSITTFNTGLALCVENSN